MSEREAALDRRLFMEAGRPVAIAEIARRAGVSIALVSSFLSGKTYSRSYKSGIRIGAQTRDRLLEVCRSIGYKPEKTAVFNRIYPHLGELVLMIETGETAVSDRVHLNALLEGMLSASIEQGSLMSVATYSQHDSYIQEPEKLPIGIMDGRIRKLIFWGPVPESLRSHFDGLGCHLLHLGHHGSAGLPGVDADYAHAGRMAWEQLRGCGHRQIAVIGAAPRRDCSQTQHMLQAFQDRSEGWTHEQLCWLTPTCSTAWEQLDQLRAQHPGVTAVVCLDLEVQSEVSCWAEARELSIPDDWSVLTLGSPQFMGDTEAPLTLLEYPAAAMGRQAVHRINRLASGEPLTEPDTLRVHFPLQERGSIAQLTA